MKKIIRNFILAICLILPATFCLTACGDNENANVVGVSVELGANLPYTLTNGEILVEYGEKVAITDKDFVITATMDNDETKILSIRSDSNPIGYTFSSTIPENGVTPLGEYQLTFEYADTAGTKHKIIKVKVVTRNVNPSSLGLVWTSGLEFNGSAQSVTITNLPDYLQASYSDNTQTYPNGTTAPGGSIAQADSYTATATISVKENMAGKYILAGEGVTNGNYVVTHNWTIGKKTISMPSTDNIMESYTYDGSQKTAKIKSDVASQLTAQNITPLISGSTTGRNANNYQISISFKYTGADKDYCDLGTDYEIESINTTWTINPKSIDTSNFALIDIDDPSRPPYTEPFTYSSGAQNVDFDLSNLETFLAGESPILTASKTGGVFSATIPGTYTAKTTFIVNNANYVVTNATIEKEWAINARIVNTSNILLKIKDGEGFNIANASAYTDGSFTYDGTQKQVVIDTRAINNLGYTARSWYPNAEGMTTRILNTVTSGIFSATEAGTYTATISFTLNEDTENNRLGYVITNPTITFTWKIAPKQIDVNGISLKVKDGDAYTENSFTYNGSAKEVEFDLSSLSSSIITGELSSILSTTTSGASAINGGTHTATITFTVNNTNYSVSSATVSKEWKINKLTINTGDIELNNNELTYNGSAQSVSMNFEGLTEYVSGDTPIIVWASVCDGTYTNKATNAGDYSSKFTLSIGESYTENYSLSDDTITKVWSIKKVRLTLGVKDRTGDNALTYGDTVSYSASDVIVTGLVGDDTVAVLGEFEFEYKLSSSGDYGSALPKNAGNYTVIASINSTNYTSTYTEGNLEIKKAILTVTVSDAQYTYGTVGGCEIDIAGFKYGEVLKRNPYDTTPNSIIISGNRKLYDAKNNVELSMNGSSFIAVGTYQYRPHCSAKNYDFEYIYGDYVIVPKNIEVTATLKNPLTYGDELISSNVEINYYNDGKIDSEVENTLTYITSYKKGDNAGDYAITARGLRCTTGNYNITYPQSTFTVAPKNVTVKPIEQKIFYGDSIKLGLDYLETIEWVKSEDVFVFYNNINYEFKTTSGEFSSTVPTGAGDYKYRIKPFTSSNSSYVLTFEEADCIIARRPIKILVGNATAEYGSDLSKLDISVTYGGTVYYDTNINKYINESLAFTYGSGAGETLRDGVIAINSSFANGDNESLFASFEEFKFGLFMNDVFTPYDESSESMRVGIFLQIDRVTEGPNLTNAVDNYIIVVENGLLTLTKKTINISSEDIVWQANGKNIDVSNDVVAGLTSVVDYTGKAISITIDASKLHPALSILYKYKSNAGKVGLPLVGDLTEVSEIKNAGNYIVNVTISLTDTVHYELSSANTSLSLNIKVEPNVFSTKNASNELCAVKVDTNGTITYLTYSELVKSTNFVSGQTISFSLIDDKNNTEPSDPGEALIPGKNTGDEGYILIKPSSLSSEIAISDFEGYKVMWNGERIYAVNDVYTITLDSSKSNELKIIELWSGKLPQPDETIVLTKIFL